MRKSHQIPVIWLVRISQISLGRSVFIGPIPKISLGQVDQRAALFGSRFPGNTADALGWEKIGLFIVPPKQNQDILR